jgi:hypothetical protein
VTHFGDWGAGVNGGGWLMVNGRRMDFLYRDLGAVRTAVEDSFAGCVKPPRTMEDRRPNRQPLAHLESASTDLHD